MKWKHDVKIAWRNLMKYKQQTIISVVGLAVGLACFVICNEQLRDVFMWNKKLPHIDKIYVLAASNADDEFYQFVNALVARKLTEDFPEIGKSVIFYDLGGYTDKFCVVEQEDGDKTWKKESFLYSDSSFMAFFDFSLVQGNWEKAKMLPDAVILTESAAIRIFGSRDVVGRTFQDVDDFNNASRTYRIAGVMPDFPPQTRFEAKAGLVLNPADDKTLKGGNDDSAEVWVRLVPGTDEKQLNEKLTTWLDKHPEWKESRNVPQKISLYSQVQAREEFRWTLPLLLTGIGFLVLLTAVFNYVLFMSGRILNRQKEYAVRQISGASHAAIFRMFATEITLTFGGAVLFAFILFELIIHLLTEDISSVFSFNTGQNLMFHWGKRLWEDALIVWGIMLLISGSILKRMQAISSLRNLQGTGRGPSKSRMQFVLLGLQLTVCVLLGGGAYFMYTQQQYLQRKMMGKLTPEECDRIYSFSLNGDKLEPIRADFKSMVQAIPYVEMATRSGNSLLKPWRAGSDRWQMEGIDEKGDVNLNFMYTDANYAAFVHAQMEEGRFFRENEMESAVVNRAFVRCWGVNPLGKVVSFDYWRLKNYRIVGIIEDLSTSDNNPVVVPCIYLPFQEEDPNWTYYIKLRRDADPKVLDPLKAKMREQLSPFTPVWISTLKEEIDWGIDYMKEIGLLMGLLSSICVVISLLGIYSSMMLAVEKRRREMAIRKINGASLQDIARIFLRHYLWLTGGAVLLAYPVLFWGVSRWWQNYTYHPDMTAWPFGVILILLLGVILLTIGAQLLKIMHINPAQTMKRE